MKGTKLLCTMLCALLAGGLFVSCDKGLEQPGTGEEQPVKTEILTHVFKGDAIALPENYHINNNVDMVYQDGRLKMLCRESYQEGEKYIQKHWIYEMNLDNSGPVWTEVVLGEEQYINSGVFVEDGLLFLDNTYDELTGIATYMVRKWTTEGVTTLCENVNDLFSVTRDPNWFHIQEIQADGDGYIYLSADMAVVVLNPDGTLAFEYTSGDYIQEMRRSTDGKVYLAGHMANGFGLQLIDRETKSTGAVLQLPEGIHAYEYYFGPGYDFYYSVDSGLYGFNMDMTEGELVLSWPNSDINADSVQQIQVISADTVLATYTDRSSADYTNITALLKKAPDIDLSKITVIEMAYIYSDYDLPNQIIGFNRANDGIRVVTKDYSSYNTEENDYRGGYTKLMNDILNGIYTPDLVCGSTGDELTSVLTERGLFADLYTFMETDPDIKKDDIVGCVKNTFEVDGKLSALCRNFELDTMLATKEFTGGRTSWTLDELLDAAVALEEGEYLMERLTRESAANYLLGINSYGWFIDLEKGECNFEDPLFIKYLNYIATLPSAEEGGYRGEDRENRYEPYQTGKVKLYQQYYWDINDIFGDIVPFNTPDVVRIGFPVAQEGESGTILSAVNYMILSDSEHPTEAWQFLRTLVMPVRDMMRGRDGFPVLKSAMAALAEEYSDRNTFYSFDGGTTSWSGENEHMQLDENGRLNGQAGILVKFDQEVFDEFCAWLETVGTPLKGAISEELRTIINEEITVFTGGARTAEDTAKIIQSRVSIWLAEHS